MSAIGAVLDAVGTTLGGDATLTGLATVTNDRNDETPYPYVLVANATEKPWHTMGGGAVGRGFEVKVWLHIYSDYEGDDEVTGILDRIVALIDHQVIAVTGYATAIWEYMGIRPRILIESDQDRREVRHAPAEIRVMVHQ